jgi:hypothetical protein
MKQQKKKNTCTTAKRIHQIKNVSTSLLDSQRYNELGAADR